MITKRMSLIVFIATFLSIGSVFAQGGQDSGGIDVPNRDASAAWFLGAAPVSTCIEVAPEFGVTPEFAREQLTLAIDQWTKYLYEHTYNSDHLNRISTDFAIHMSCTGTEELQVLLGTESETLKLIQARYSNPIAFAHRESYSPDTGRGRGFVWVQKGRVIDDFNILNWSKEGTLHGILLHELGHVFGTGHVEGTIMDDQLLIDNIYWKLWYDWGGSEQVQNREKRLYQLSHIDSTRQLLISKNMRSIFIDQIQSPLIFTQFIGRSPVGNWQATMEFDPIFKKITFIIKDTLLEKIIEIPIYENGTRETKISSSSKVFHTYRNTESTLREGWRTSKAISVFSQIPDSQGVPVPVLVEFGYYGKMTMRSMDATGGQFLFQAKME